MPPPELISVATRCATPDDFLRLFQKYVDRNDGSVFVVAKVPRPIGTRQPFQIKLKDGTVVMRGQAEVVGSYASGEGFEGRRGYRIKVSALDDDSARLYKQLLGRGTSRKRTRAPAARAGPAPPTEALAPEPAVIVDLDATGPRKTPVPELRPRPTAFRKIAARPECEVLVTRQDAADQPPWMRIKIFDPARVPPEQ